jgi:leucyl aminopeptidase (aminopeptidase T)
MQSEEAAKNALEGVLEASVGERVVIICDDEKSRVGRAFAEGALDLGLWTRLITLETGEFFREEIPRFLLEILSTQKPDIYVNLLRGVREETPFRIRLIKRETRDKKSRLGHCPGVTLDMLTEGALALKTEEHRSMQAFARKLIKRLGDAVQVEISSPSGTELSLSVEGRPFYTDTLIDWKTLKWMNLPTGEVIVAPVETSLEGRLVCDMAIGGIGPVDEPVDLIVEGGEVQESRSDDEQTLQRVRQSLDTDEWSRVVGEFAFGINPKARFVEEFLEAEKILGTIHLAFGNNTDMPGGMNPSQNHMDLMISKPTVHVIDQKGSREKILEDGEFTSG